MKKRRLEDFNLQKIKYKDGVLSFKAELTLQDGETIYKPILDDKVPIAPHPDLIDLFDDMKRPLAQLHGLLDVETLVMSNDFGATRPQKLAAESHVEYKLADVKVTGASISGKDGNRGIVIIGIYDGQAINGKKLKFTGEKYGFESELEDIVQSLIVETYKFKSENTKNQLDAFGSEPAAPIHGTSEQFQMESTPDGI